MEGETTIITYMTMLHNSFLGPVSSHSQKCDLEKSVSLTFSAFLSHIHINGILIYGLVAMISYW
uniref:Uncharacterized protein n=1 Tax=Octopus bimaculoides TaxID=37653 RepID=A0A0L8FM82_OCTBM